MGVSSMAHGPLAYTGLAAAQWLNGSMAQWLNGSMLNGKIVNGSAGLYVVKQNAVVILVLVLSRWKVVRDMSCRTHKSPEIFTRTICWNKLW